VCSGALPDGSRWLHVEPRERTASGGDNRAEYSWQETKLLSGVFVRSFSHHLMSCSLHHAASQLTHEVGMVALNILRYLVCMRTELFECLKIQALIDKTPFLLLNSTFQSSLLPPCAQSQQPHFGLPRLCRWSLQGALYIYNYIKQHVISQKFESSSVPLWEPQIYCTGSLFNSTVLCWLQLWSVSVMSRHLTNSILYNNCVC
jgi:hypothetical protein